MPTPNDFSDYRCTGSNSTDRGEGRLGKAGEPHGQESPYAPATPEVAADNYPNIFNYGYDPQNREFTNDKSQTPQQFASDTAVSQTNFTDLQQHLMNSLDTIGSRISHPANKPWTPPYGAEGE